MNPIYAVHQLKILQISQIELIAGTATNVANRLFASEREIRPMFRYFVSAAGIVVRMDDRAWFA